MTGRGRRGPYRDSVKRRIHVPDLRTGLRTARGPARGAAVPSGASPLPWRSRSPPARPGRARRAPARRPRRRRRAASASPSSGASTPAGSPSPSAGLESASADEVLAAARAALLRRLLGARQGRPAHGGTSYTIDLRMVRGAGAVGTVGSKGGSRPWSGSATRPTSARTPPRCGPPPAARAPSAAVGQVLLGDLRAIRLPFAPFLALTDAEQAFGPTLAPTGTVTKGAVSTVNGRRVVDLLVDGGSSGDVFVALDGPPYPVRIGYGKGGQHVDFDGYGREGRLAAPPKAHVRAGPDPGRLTGVPGTPAPGAGGTVHGCGWSCAGARGRPAAAPPSPRSPTSTPTPPPCSARWRRTPSRTATTCAPSTPSG